MLFPPPCTGGVREVMSYSEDKESLRRSAIKGLSWRLLATGTTFLLAWIFAKDLSVAYTLAGAEFVIKYIIYFAHERVWQRVRLRSEGEEVVLSAEF